MTVAAPADPERRRSRAKRSTTEDRLQDPDKPKEEAPKEPKSEPLCIVDGECAICKAPAKPNKWGNPRCCGCSVVDILPFNDHLFKMLLVPQESKNLRPLDAKPPLKVRRHAMTPPP